jgi:hypothetical protein
MQEQTGRAGAGGAVDMEEGHAHQQQCAGAGRLKGSVQGGEQGGSIASDRFEVRAVMRTSEVLIDRGAADRGFAAARGPRCQDALECDPACTTVPWQCCQRRERLQVRPLLANRGSAWCR